MSGKTEGLRTRCITAACLIAALALLIALGKVSMGVLFVGGVGLCVYEELHALRVSGARPVDAAAYAALIAFALMSWLGACRWEPWVLALLGAAVAAAVMFRREPKLEDILYTFLPVLSVALPGQCLMLFLNTATAAESRFLVILSIAVPIVGDTFAYFVGSTVGGPKLCPPVSPHKTVSGSLAGLAGSVLGAWLVGVIFRGLYPEIVPGTGRLLLLGLITGAMGQTGDLFASLVKRHCGLKDYSHIFPGHGGMLDRIDSVLFAAPAVYFLILVLK